MRKEVLFWLQLGSIMRKWPSWNGQCGNLVRRQIVSWLQCSGIFLRFENIFLFFSPLTVTRHQFCEKDARHRPCQLCSVMLRPEWIELWTKLVSGSLIWALLGCLCCPGWYQVILTITLSPLHRAASHSAFALMYNYTLTLLFLWFFFQDSNLLKQNNLLQLPLVNVITTLSH